jgi:hypothetical protein
LFILSSTDDSDSENERPIPVPVPVAAPAAVPRNNSAAVAATPRTSRYGVHRPGYSTNNLRRVAVQSRSPPQQQQINWLAELVAFSPPAFNFSPAVVPSPGSYRDQSTVRDR